MAPAPPLPVTEDTPPDMLAGSMDLRVFLPNGQSVKMSVDRSTPMMDLLVQVTTVNKISPGGHVLQAVGERGILPYKPSTPIGALDTWTIHVVPKGKPFGTSGPSVTPKKAPLKPLNQQPFEQTFRLQVHLPRNQLYVMRVSPKTRLSDILIQTCAEKNLDSSKYEMRHPANLSEALNMSCTLADYKLLEVTVVSKSSLGSALSSSDIMALQREEEKRRQQARQQHGPGTGLGLVFNKRNQSSACEGSVSSDSLGGRSISPARSDESASRSASPPAPVIPPMMAPPTRPARKRRPAPKPPSTPAKQIEGVRKTTAESSDAPVVNGNVPKGKGIPVSHSRNSSDSSGYHEASVLSESPAEGNQMPENCSDSLQRQSKLPPLRPKSQGDMCLSSSMSSLSGSNSQENTVATCQLSTSNSSLASSTGLGLRKKKAPPPPPGSAKTTSLDRNKSVSLDPEPQRRSTYPGKLKSAASLERSSSTESESSLQGQPKLEHYPSTETEELDVLPEDGSENNESAATHNQETIPDPNLPDIVSDPTVESSRRPSSPPVEPAPAPPTSVTASALPSGVPHSSPASVTAVPIVTPGEDAETSHNLEQQRSILHPVVSSLTTEKQLLPENCRNNNRHKSVNNHSGESDNNEELTVPEKEKCTHLFPKQNRRGCTFGVGKTLMMLTSGSDSMSKNSLLNDVSLEDDIDMNNLEMFELKKESTNQNKFVESSPEKVATLGHSFESTDLSSLQVFNSKASTNVTIPQLLEEDGDAIHGSWNNMESLAALGKQPKVQGSEESGTEVDDAVNQVDAAFQSVTEMEAVIRKEEEQEQLNDLPPPLSPTASELEEWEYQLPAPPSAFRDAAGSPTPTDAGETVVLADAQVFQESAAETAPVCQAMKDPPSNKNEIKHKTSSVTKLDSAQLNSSFTVETVAVIEVAKKGKRQKHFKTQENPCEFSAELSNTVEKNKQEPKKKEENSIKSIPLEESLNSKTESTPVKNKEKEEQEVSYVANNILKTEQPETVRDRTLMPSMRKDVSQPFKPNVTALERKPVSVQKVIEKQTQVRQPKDCTSEPVETSHLSNFTITTYQRPHDSAYDILTEEENNRWSSRKLGGSTSLTYLNSTSSKVSRANSFNASDESISLASPVKRSTSYISLEANPAPEMQLLSGGSSASSYVSRTKSTGNLAVAEEEHWQGSTLRKAASNLDIGNEQRIMQQFLQLQEQLQANAPSDVPLQSLQVLRSILPQLTQAASGIPSIKSNFQRSNSNENSQGMNGTSLAPPEPARQTTTVTLSHMDKTAVTTTATSTSNNSNNRNVSSDNRANICYRNKETFAPSYQSNEKTGFKSNNIEKRNSWNISQENSNNSGNENTRLTDNSTETNDNLNKEKSNGNNEKIIEDKMNVTKRYSYQGPPAINFTTWSERPKSQVSIKLDRDYRIGGRGAPEIKQEERNEQPEPTPAKTEPVQLTMRLVSHATTAPATYKSSSVSINGHKDPVVAQQQQVRLGTSDPSRVPIVRAVELKKSFVQRTLGWNSVNGESTEPTPTKDNANKSEPKQNGQEDEIFIGVNSLARKFGPPASFRAPRPLSMYGKIERTEEGENGMGQRSTSTSNLLQQQQQQQKTQRSPRRYTSVVGINNPENEEHRVLSSSSSFREPPHLKHSSSIVRVNGIGAPKQLMPVVKGFQFASPAANRENPPVVRPQVSITKVQRSESASGNSWKSNQNSRQNVKPVELQNGNALESTPPPPPPPFAMTLKKVSDRPRQPPLPAGNPRDLLMDAIRNFGGRDKLRQVRETQSSLNVVLIR